MMRTTNDASHDAAVSSRTPYRMGVDIGGTFTDFVLVDDRTGQLRLEKVLTTPDDPSRAVRQGLERLLTGEVRPADVSVLIHGTTLVINALIERKGARTALITTRGFRDSLQVAREYRYDIYELDLAFPAPLVPRRWRYEVGERVLASGRIETPLDDEELVRVAAEIRTQGMESVAVCFLHSYRNPRHELRAREILEHELPGIPVTLSHEVLGQVREYERAVLTAMNAYVRPVIQQYLARVQHELEVLRFGGKWYVMASNGGILTPETAADFPVRILESGPVGGALAAAHHGLEVGRRELVAFDMGGTTAKACIIEDGAPGITTDYEVARVSRFMKGSGLPAKLPVVNMIEIGAGGGSIASVDALGLLNVGPESAGAAPGPVCYGRGGTKPTVTDANLILGYLDAGYFLGGEMSLDVAAAEGALAHLGASIGRDAVTAAWGVHEVVTNNMAEALRTHAAERGVDYQRLSMVAFGGAGPLHAYSIARILRIREVLFPRAAGVFSALGFLTAPLSFDLARSGVARIDELPFAEVRTIYSGMEERANAFFRSAGIPRSDVRFELSVDMRYAGQGFEITVQLPDTVLRDGKMEALAEAFEDAYRAQYGRVVDGATIQAVTWRCLGLGPKPQLRVAASANGRTTTALKGHRKAYVGAGQGFADFPVYDRYALRPGDEIRGPALVEERECTVLVGPAAVTRVDGLGNLVMEVPL